MDRADPLEFILDEELLQTFHRQKTTMSCMDNPQTFLNQLRDHKFVPEDKYEKVSRMKSRERIKQSIYEILDWVANKRSKDIRRFWKCVFNDVVLNEYPTISKLHRSFLDGSFRSATQLAQTADEEAGDSNKSGQLSENEKKQKHSVKRKRKRKSESDDAQEQPGPSSLATPTKTKKSQKVIYSSPLKKGEKGEIWNWPIYKSHLPVTCGDQKATLQRERLAKGEKCIWVNEQWLTPNEFEKLGGKERNKNWKYSIRCEEIPLGTLIKEGHLKCSRRKKGSKRTKKSLPAVPLLITDSEEDDVDEETSNDDEEPQSSADEEEDAACHDDESQKFFNVTCGALTGKLYKERFATGSCGKSIRTETSWMTPKDFAKKGLDQTDILWRRDVQWEGKPLSCLIEKAILRIHASDCSCKHCEPDEDDQKNQENDDECWVCRSNHSEDVVVCDYCPRAFHQKCHLPHIEDCQLSDDGPWKCTICAFERSQGGRDTDTVDKNGVMSYQMPQYTQECRFLILSLCGADEKQRFATNPSLYLRNYSSFIRNPMWLSKVADKLQNNKYQTVGQFVSDVQLIFTNCAEYYASDEDICAIGEKLKQLFERQFMTAFNVRE
ncbi:unnamed protein product [Ophioblennius macclurei]